MKTHSWWIMSSFKACCTRCQGEFEIRSSGLDTRSGFVAYLNGSRLCNVNGHEIQSLFDRIDEFKWIPDCDVLREQTVREVMES